MCYIVFEQNSYVYFSYLCVFVEQTIMCFGSLCVALCLLNKYYVLQLSMHYILFLLKAHMFVQCSMCYIGDLLKTRLGLSVLYVSDWYFVENTYVFQVSMCSIGFC